MHFIIFDQMLTATSNSCRHSSFLIFSKQTAFKLAKNANKHKISLKLNIVLQYSNASSKSVSYFTNILIRHLQILQLKSALKLHRLIIFGWPLHLILKYIYKYSNEIWNIKTKYISAILLRDYIFFLKYRMFGIFKGNK